ncbi:MAG TPA: Insertion element protein [Streptosporangiaceae bacterium]|jgi:transposase-like protein|nr:Insertion element protein [Streptosporangiaceae bacterium]
MTAAGGGEPEAEVGERQVPFFCPYCGEEELRPAGSKAGDWECRSCARSFTLRFTGVAGRIGAQS